MKKNNNLTRIFNTAIRPTIAIVLVVGFVCLLLSGIVWIIYRDRVRFDPSGFITEVCKIGVTTTLLFWLVEYQREKTEIGREEYAAKMFIRNSLLKNLNTLRKLLLVCLDKNAPADVGRARAIEQSWDLFYNLYVNLKNNPMPGMDETVIQVPEDLPKIAKTYKNVMPGEDETILNRKIDEVNRMINHFEKYK